MEIWDVILFLILFLICVLAWAILWTQIARIQRQREGMKRHAAEVLASMGSVDETEVYVAFASLRGRLALIEEKKVEMARQGWTYLRMREAPVRRTLLSWGGGLIVQFVRPASQM